MKTKAKQSGVSLMEMVVVLGAVALLGTLSLPAIRAFNNSLGSVGSVKAMISAGLASARAIAAKEQRYAGIRFQRRYQLDGKGPQYMIFILHDRDKTNRANGFRAIEGIEPMKLPNNIVARNSNDEFTFSVVFSPSGKLVRHKLWVKSKSGSDDVFNTAGNGMFLEDSENLLSENSLTIYETESGNTEHVYINPYTGRIIRN